MRDDRYTPLLPQVNQFEVDFVVPRVGVDLPVGIDPFLLFKSRDPSLASLNKLILDAFNAGLDFTRRDKLDEARYILDYPEAAELGFGNSTSKGKRGSGVGTYLTELIIETLRESPALMERGIRHIEEMQLVSIGIGPDRISDISANLIKSYLIEYTQKQCELWSLPIVSGVPIKHVFDTSNFSWIDGYYDLPLSPFDQSPILFAPRRIVRTLPWINYDDFFRMEFSAFLRAQRVKGKLSQHRAPKNIIEKDKRQVISVARAEVQRIDHYVTRKEEAAPQAQPSKSYIPSDNDCREGNDLKARLSAIPTGREHASEYQHAVLGILNYLFNPELIDGETEVKTIEGTERRDIVFTNDSDINFLEYIRREHSSIFIMFETKNMKEIEAPAFNQTATYLGERLGQLGFIVTRNNPSTNNLRKAFSIYNDSRPRKVILILSDDDLNHLLDTKCKGSDPVGYLQKLYRKFRTSVQ